MCWIISKLNHFKYKSHSEYQQNCGWENLRHEQTSVSSMWSLDLRNVCVLLHNCLFSLLYIILMCFLGVVSYWFYHEIRVWIGGGGGRAPPPPRRESMALTLSGPDTPAFLFLEVCEANRLQCSYSQHSTLKTANQRSCCTCHSWCSWSSVARNGIMLRCLQSHKWSPHRTSINTWKKVSEFFFNLIHV
jgi:hypothetical protein